MTINSYRLPIRAFLPVYQNTWGQKKKTNRQTSYWRKKILTRVLRKKNVRLFIYWYQSKMGLDTSSPLPQRSVLTTLLQYFSLTWETKRKYVVFSRSSTTVVELTSYSKTGCQAFFSLIQPTLNTLVHGQNIRFGLLIGFDLKEN